MNYANPFLVSIRRLGQRLGVLRPLVRLFRRIFPSNYEEAFEQAMMSAIRPGDTIWDVGANVGIFTRRFSEQVGPTGCVVAFEPSPAASARCREVVPKATVLQLALSDWDGETDFYVGDDAIAPTNSLERRATSRTATRIRVMTGDTVISQCLALPPNHIKIDVEGFEVEVVRGLSETLRSPSLKSVFIEVHFLNLAERGLRTGPTEIVRLLQRAGYDTRWVDPSHLVALR